MLSLSFVLMSVAIATIPPSDHLITNLSNRTLNGIFNSQYGGYQHKWEIEHIIKLLNRIGRDPRIPDDIRGAWGDSVKAIASAKEAVHNIGVRGDATKHQNKQAIMSSMMVLDNNGQLINKQLLNEVAPHKCPKSKKKYIKKAIAIRRDFDSGRSELLCEVKELQRRNSSVLHAFFV